jgi:hypothetical protein
VPVSPTCTRGLWRPLRDSFKPPPPPCRCAPEQVCLLTTSKCKIPKRHVEAETSDKTSIYLTWEINIFWVTHMTIQTILLTSLSRLNSGSKTLYIYCLAI